LYNNFAKNAGGAIAVHDSDIYIIGSNISANRCDNLTPSSGGGFSVNDSTINIKSSIIADNYSSNLGGGIATSDTELHIANSRIIQNTSGKGGGLFCNGDNIEIINCEILRNKTEIDEGGGLFLNFIDTLDIYSSSICLNSAETQGGGLFITGSYFETNFYNTIFFNNKKNSGSSDDFYHSTGLNINNSYNCNISNSIFTSNNLTFIDCIRTEPMFRDTDEAELTGTIEFTKYSRTVTGVDSKFIDEVQIGDSIYLTADGMDYMLCVTEIINNTKLILSSRYMGDAIYAGSTKVLKIHIDLQSKSQGDANESPCIDAGNNNYAIGMADIFGRSRIIDGDTNGYAIVDIGAREKQ